MHAGHTTLEILAYMMIAFLFLFRGVTAIPQFARHAAKFRGLRIPFPGLFLTCGLVTMFVGGFSVALDYHAPVGAVMLIVFTMIANLTYHNFWSMSDPELKNRHLYIFCNNVAVMGGLVLIAVA